MTSQSSVDESVEGSGHQVTRVNVSLGSATIAIVISLMLVIAACGLVMGLNLAKQEQLDRDFRLQERQDALKERRLMDMEAYLIVNGWKMPKDDAFGPTGNIERMQSNK